MPGSTASEADVPRGVSRRALLRATGIGAVGLAAAPWLRHAAALESATPVTGVTDGAWDDLANRLRGRLLRPGDILYPAATIINATRYMGDRPTGIAICAIPEDAAVCVTWARDNGVPFAVRAGTQGGGAVTIPDAPLPAGSARYRRDRALLGTIGRHRGAAGVGGAGSARGGTNRGGDGVPGGPRVPVRHDSGRDLSGQDWVCPGHPAGSGNCDHARMDQHYAGGSLPSSGEHGGTLLLGRQGQ